MVRILALLLFVLSGSLLAAEKADTLFEYGGLLRNYGAELFANYQNGALSVAVSGKEIRPGQADDNGEVVVADNRILQFSVMRVGSKSGKVISEMDSRQILEAHRQSRVSFMKTLADKPVVSEPGIFKTVGGRNIYFWHADTAPAPVKKKASPDKVWRYLHATQMSGDMVVILIVSLTSWDDENTARDWLEKTAATLTVHSKPFIRDDDKARQDG